ncbi:DUF6703 family protein [Actinomadura alba]|uniref:AI-2E family transporter n=1 Tax=Actinomadura alba TaxID=406431 RepID=A0ABR7LGJ6_9ACTN|nr:DUF6703 family protein [Actinomadura alba]MBC6463966.1 hypothetical protein [Actinomadura alba]
MGTRESGAGGRDPRADGAGGFRAEVERRSATLVVFLHRLPRWTLLVAIFAVLAVGMLGTGWLGASALLVLASFLAWFAFLNWPTLDASGKLLRIAGVGVLLAFAVDHALGVF